jgi:hypothetical protein
VKAFLKTCFSGLKSSRWVGDFQVATGGGFWVATRANGSYLYATYQNKVLDEFGNENDERFSNVKEWQEVTYE